MSLYWWCVKIMNRIFIFKHGVNQMGVRDALLLNLTGSNFQALQTDDTARLKGDLSLQKDDGTEVLGIDVTLLP